MEGYNEKILVVDAEESTRQVLNTRLTLLGYNVLLGRNGNDALVIFNKEQPDLVILDIVLSKLDGYEVCRKIRKISETPIFHPPEASNSGIDAQLQGESEASKI